MLDLTAPSDLRGECLGRMEASSALGRPEEDAVIRDAQLLRCGKDVSGDVGEIVRKCCRYMM